LRHVIQLIVAGETAKAAEALSTIYCRLAPPSEEKTHDAPVAGVGTRKRTAGLRTSWQGEKGESNREEKPETTSSVGQKDSRVAKEEIDAKGEIDGSS
jgi:hypothetical protein